MYCQMPGYFWILSSLTEFSEGHSERTPLWLLSNIPVHFLTGSPEEMFWVQCSVKEKMFHRIFRRIMRCRANCYSLQQCTRSSKFLPRLPSQKLRRKVRQQSHNILHSDFYRHLVYSQKKDHLIFCVYHRSNQFDTSNALKSLATSHGWVRKFVETNAMPVLYHEGSSGNLGFFQAWQLILLVFSQTFRSFLEKSYKNNSQREGILGFFITV